MKSPHNLWVGSVAAIVLGLSLWIHPVRMQPVLASPRLVPPASPQAVQFPVPGGEPRGLAWDGQHFWLVDNLRKVYQLSTQGQVLKQFQVNFAPSGMTWDGTALWIGDDDNQLQVRIDTQGKEMDSLPIYFGPDNGIAWDGSSLWVGDASQGEFHRYSLGGEELEVFGIKDANIEHASGLVFDKQNLWIGDSNEGLQNNLARFKTDGHLLADYNIHIWGLSATRSPEYKSLAWDGQYLWYTANDLGNVYRIEVNVPPAGQVHLYLPLMIAR